MGCVNHPSLPQAMLFDGKPYCAKCKETMAAAEVKLDPHVSPRPCFVWYRSSATGFGPIEGTGCAHFVSHRLHIRTGHAGAKCLAGYTHRVATMLSGRTKVLGGLAAVRVNHIWVNADRTHCGIVTAVAADPPAGYAQDGNAPVIWITHSSSHLHRVSLDRFDGYFRSEGEFYR